MKQNGSTLFELLLVMAIMAILAALLLPTLSKRKSRSIWCSNNQKQLQLAWQMYGDDNNESLPLNWDGSPLGSWVVGFANRDKDTSKLELGTLHPYVSSTRVYCCPADKSTVDAERGGTLRTRHYAMSCYMNCNMTRRPDIQRGVVFHKMSEINQPSPAEAFVFMHTSPQTTGDGECNLPIIPWLWGAYPFDHEKGQIWSFADGHVASRRWQEEDTVRKSILVSPPGTTYASSGNRDYIALQAAAPFWWILNPIDQNQ